MMIAGIILLGLLGLVVVVALWFMGAYNSLVTFRENTKRAFSDIDIQLRQRFDMIPQLVECAKGYMKHEKDSFKEIVEARNEALSALNAIKQGGGDISQSQMENLQTKTAALDKAFAGFKVTVENYPELKAVDTVKELQESIQSVENKINFARTHYNQSVNDYTVKSSQFPTCIVAMVMSAKFPAFPYYNDNQKEEIQERPTISF